jgi:hypothetical protein
LTSEVTDGSAVADGVGELSGLTVNRRPVSAWPAVAVRGGDWYSWMPSFVTVNLS